MLIPPPVPSTARLRVTALGHTIDLGVVPETLPRLRAQWSRCLAAPDATADVEVDLGRTDSPGYDYAATTQVTLSAVDLLSARRLNLHAAGVADGSGRVLSLIAASGTGKTTACARLARELGYVTDECVSIGLDEHDVLPFPKPLSFRRQRADDPSLKTQLGPDELGLAVARAPLRLGPMVLLERTPEAGTPHLSPVDLTTALLELVPQSSALPRLPDPLRVLVDVIRRAGGVHRLAYAEIDDAVPLLTDLLHQDTPQDTPQDTASVLHVPNPGDLPDPTRGPTEVASEPLDGIDRLQRTPWTDAVAIDDAEVVVLIGTQPILLRGVGAVLWREAAAPTRIDELLRHAVRVLGEHPAAEHAVRAGASALVAAGVLRISCS